MRLFAIRRGRSQFADGTQDSLPSPGPFQVARIEQCISLHSSMCRRIVAVRLNHESG